MRSRPCQIMLTRTHCRAGLVSRLSSHPRPSHGLLLSCVERVASDREWPLLLLDPRMMHIHVHIFSVRS